MEFKILKPHMYLEIELLLLSILKDCKHYFIRKSLLHYVDKNDECYDASYDVGFEITEFLTEDYMVLVIATHIAKHIYNPVSQLALHSEITCSYNENKIDIHSFTIAFQDYINFRDHRDYTKKLGQQTKDYTQEAYYQSLIEFLAHKVYVRGY